MAALRTTLALEYTIRVLGCELEDCLVWQLLDADGKGHGQAATFSGWTDEV
ncbi:MEKHLA domain-containing protein [Rhizobium leguminosarum]|uniref:MEKHLA domain-containing protein n=1 Tax=Rhizobium leguminosarum TaxID=384 RepID=UPI003CCB275B